MNQDNGSTDFNSLRPTKGKEVKVKSNRFGLLFYSVLFLTQFACNNSTENKGTIEKIVADKFISDTLKLNFSHSNNLDQVISMFKTSNKSLLSNYDKNKLSLYELTLRNFDSTRLIGSFTLPQSIASATLIDSLRILCIEAHTGKFYIFNCKDSSSKAYIFPKYYSSFAKDSLTVYPDLSASNRPILLNDKIVFTVRAFSRKTDYSNNEILETVFSAPTFCIFNLRAEDFNYLGSFNYFGMNPEINYKKFGGTEYRVNVCATNTNELIVTTPKTELVFSVNSISKNFTRFEYSYAKDYMDFNAGREEDEDGSQYVTRSSFYSNAFIINDSLLVRVLKKGSTSNTQLGQKETPWELVIISIRTEQVIAIIDFKANHFDYGDIHLFNKHLLLVSNRGIENSAYEATNHSYSIIDFNRLTKFLQ